MKKALTYRNFIITLALSMFLFTSYKSDTHLFNKCVFPTIDNIDKAWSKTDLNGHIKGDSIEGYEIWGRNHYGTDFRITQDSTYIADSLENYVKIKDIDGDSTINSNLGYLMSSPLSVSLRWKLGDALDETQNLSLTWKDRKLYSTNNYTLDWQATTLLTGDAVSTCNWGASDLIGDWLATGNFTALNVSGTNTGDNLKGLYDSTVVSVDSFVVPISPTVSDTSYVVSITGNNLLSAVPYFITNKTDSSFTANAVTGLTGTVSFSWSLTK